jgi:hypothetical protein
MRGSYAEYKQKDTRGRISPSWRRKESSDAAPDDLRSSFETSLKAKKWHRDSVALESYARRCSWSIARICTGESATGSFDGKIE